MNIALDYDGTYTADPTFWNKFIRLARRAGHRVIIATSRMKHGVLESEQPIARDLNVGVDAVVFCNHNLKDEVCRKHGWTIDVWIDDRPESIKEQ